MMTAKDRRRLERLERENAELRHKLAQHMRIYSDALVTICELKARIDTARDALQELME